MTIQTESPGVTAQTYQQIQSFYARQMRLLDDGRTEEWAGTFTEDGVFTAGPRSVRTRSAIAAGAAEAAADFAKKRVRRRHWLGMVSASTQPDGTVRAECYALVITTPVGGQPTIGASTTCDDVLVEEDGEWKVRERMVVRDDLV